MTMEELHQIQGFGACLENKVEKINQGIGPGGDGVDITELKGNKPESKINDKRAVVMGQVQSLMQELEEKREADKRMVEEFRVRLQRMVDQLCHEVEERLLLQHQETNKEIEAKLQRLNEVVEKVCGMESELTNFKNAVGTLFKDLNNE